MAQVSIRRWAWVCAWFEHQLSHRHFFQILSRWTGVCARSWVGRATKSRTAHSCTLPPSQAPATLAGVSKPKKPELKSSEAPTCRPLFWGKALQWLQHHIWLVLEVWNVYFLIYTIVRICFFFIEIFWIIIFCICFHEQKLFWSFAGIGVSAKNWNSNSFKGQVIHLNGCTDLIWKTINFIGSPSCIFHLCYKCWKAKYWEGIWFFFLTKLWLWDLSAKFKTYFFADWSMMLLVAAITWFLNICQSS